MKILIQIEDRPNGEVGLQVKPNFKELRSLLMKDDSSVAVYYAVKALSALAAVHEQSKKMAEEPKSGLILPSNFGID